MSLNARPIVGARRRIGRAVEHGLAFLISTSMERGLRRTTRRQTSFQFNSY
jgi:hypothetical protein